MDALKEIQDVLDYNPNSGLFTWKKAVNPRVKVGDVAGCLKRDGYIRIVYNGKGYQAHRLAFLFCTGYFPESYIDHRNNIRSDNRWCNLRLATANQNSHNRKRNVRSISGIKNVTFSNRHKSWKVGIRVSNVPIFLGYFKDIELAELVAVEARNKYHKEYAQHA